MPMRVADERTGPSRPGSFVCPLGHEDPTGRNLEALGLDRGLAPAPVLERQADQRSDEWVDRYRADAEKEGLPT